MSMLFFTFAHYIICINIFKSIIQNVAYFSRNKALIGSGVYTDNIDSCSWTGQLNGTVFFNRIQTFRWNFFNYRYHLLQNVISFKSTSLIKISDVYLII